MEWQGIEVPVLPDFTGFVPPEGDGTSKVMICGEAPGELEAKFSRPFVEEAPAGSTLKRLLNRAGLEREKFSLINTVWSRPPKNWLEGSPWEGEAIAAYAPFRERAIEMFRPRVIVALGNVALRACSSFGGKGTGIGSVQGYVLDGPQDGMWTIGALHPSFIMRGEQRMSGCVIWALQRAIDIARNGFVRLPARYVTRPSLDDALAFEAGYSPEQHFLSYDIETLEGIVDEEEAEDKDEDISYTITRISFCYGPGTEGYAISFPWQPPYVDIARRLLSSCGAKRVYNGNFDNPRLTAAGCPIAGRIYDTMWAWKFLQPTLPRSLGFVAPFYGWSQEPWKNTSQSEPEKYSCQDAHALQLIADGVDEHLWQKGQWRVYERHVVELGEVLTKMSANGLPFDQAKADGFSLELQAKWDERYAELQRRVPEELKPSKQKGGLKKTPKETIGLTQRLFHVLRTDLSKEEAIAFPSATEDFIVKVERWCKLEDFLPTSPLQVRGLIKHFGHKVGLAHKTKKETADDDTLKKLLKKLRSSRKDRDLELASLLQMIRECRQLSKVQGTYVKGWKPGRDGRVHATPGFWGSMFRISWRRPNISATIQDKTEDYIAGGFRKCVAPTLKRVLVESDWKGIEALLCGWFAGDEEYMRLARLGVHDYVTYIVLADQGKILQSDVPNLSLSDSDLKIAFHEIKKRFPKDRDDCKHVVHGSNYLGTAMMLADLYELVVANVKRLQANYFGRFDKLKKWQMNTLDRASRECKLRNPFGYEMPFWEVFRWDSRRRQYVLGEDAKSAVSFLPRDTAAAMLKEVLLRLKYLADEGSLLASTHDSLTAETDEQDVERIARIFKLEMEKPVPELNGLVVGVELKAGNAWHESSMQTLDLSMEAVEVV